MRTHAAASAERILAHLQQVARERTQRLSEPGLQAQVAALKAYQQARFRCSHADLLQEPRHAGAALFFLEDLYGPQDFGERDAQFARIVPALSRLFPAEVVATVGALAELHALSEGLDTRMARELMRTRAAPGRPASDCAADGLVPGASAYHAAWQAVGERAQRVHQIDLVLGLGRQLDHFTRSRLLRQSLRLMRGPAQAAGLGALQAFLERGFDTFAAMRGAEGFLARIETRERALMDALFDTPVTQATNRPAALGQLP